MTPIKICDLTYGKVKVVWRLECEVWGFKVKMSENIVLRPILRFGMYILESSCSFVKLLEGFDVKMAFSCKNWLQIATDCTESLFFKITFHWSVMAASVKNSENPMSD